MVYPLRINRSISLKQIHQTQDHQDLEILLAPHEPEVRVRVLVALDMERAPKHLGSAEEDTGLGGLVDLADGFENHVPVRTAEVGGRAEAGDGVLLGVGVVDHDVCAVFGADFGGEVLVRVSSGLSD